MYNEKLLKDAIATLKGIDLSNVESVQINNTKHLDGSSLLEVGVWFPATKDVPTADCDDEFREVFVDGDDAPVGHFKVRKERG